ncbi:peptide chain release factor N(5)-glutamine methyltransferase [Acidipropionibacterium acidipropionici]|uniref:peptide chain release factor N(5)-glutamine methyltransferase n=1 Tax=Acidipropionibacterium acidipropionici TaxID=1748 RepID=UPI00041EB1D5|nr:peptide chain release factor N(5)-glutamine methyltransferase [Acidipropionibacterium acidipropionici]ALN15869.1 protein-(glutamine-N5) methyltransferase, release factor-specific [Acidipropionibacterium acidipropionici]APZ08384.1 protein-(glutamine-N5) methyltransferase, release factor-specific [Acidipropionibacterium acidipropionici]
MTGPDVVGRQPGVAGLLGLGSRRLAGTGSPTPAADARVLLCHALDTEPSRLILAPPPDPEQVSRYRELIAARAAGTPVQYLTGEAWFRSERIEVGPGVFIPRPETELLVGEAVAEAAARVAAGESPTVIDLCTGSGAMAAALAREVPGARVHAVEADPDALVWARRNLAGCAVTLHEGDAVRLPEGMDGLVDIVMTNPPYLPLTGGEPASRQVVETEPGPALFSGEDGLDLLRDLVPHAAALLRRGGLFCFEHDPSQEASAPGLLAADGRWEQIEDHRDLAGRSRYVTARTS